MNLEDFRHIMAEETNDSAAAALLLKFMTKMGQEVSLSRPSSTNDLVGIGATKISDPSTLAAATTTLTIDVADVNGKTRLEGNPIGEETVKFKGIEPSPLGSLGTTDTTRSSRSSSSQSQAGDSESISAGMGFGGRTRRDSQDSHSPVGLMMDEEDSTTNQLHGRNPTLEAVGVFGEDTLRAQSLTDFAQTPLLTRPPH